MKQAKKLLFVLGVALSIVMGVNLVSNYPYYKHGNWHFSVFFSLTATTLGVLGGYTIFHFLFRRYNWLKNPTLKLLSSVLVFGLYGLLLMYASVAVVGQVLHIDYNVESLKGDVIYAVLFSMIIGLVVSGHSFLLHLKKASEDNLLMQQQMVQSQFDTLKNQVNPHFLFNSLNTLTVMIPQQPDVAVQFVEQMAKVFRYSLQHGGEQTVSLDTELKVVRSYLFLNEQRFDGKLRVDINLDDNAKQKRVITQSLLMLVENAIKHNEISSANPLTLTINNEGTSLLVAANTLQRKPIPEASTGVGLENIKRRYALATAMPVQVTESNNLFVVKIPLL